MKLTYLGTAAAEGWPAVFCNCDHCLRAKAKGGKNIRTRSQALINDDMLIDFPVDTYKHALDNKIDLSAIDTILFTHPHLDHCCPIDLCFRNPAYYAHNLTAPGVTMYGNKFVKDRVEQIFASIGDESFTYNFDVITDYTTYKIKSYTVTPLRANHCNGNDANVFIITENGKTLLYLHDTGMLFDDVYDYLIKAKIKADFVSYDCTYVALPSGGGHLGLDSCVVTRDKFKELGIIDEKTVNCINHFSHNGKLIHDELVPVALELGFITAYDGMSVEI